MKKTFFLIAIATCSLMLFAAPFGYGEKSGLTAQNAQAASAANRTVPLNFTPSVGIPNSEFTAGTEIPVGTYNQTADTMTSDLIGKYIQAIYNYGLAIGAILAAVILMGGGILWLVSGGDAGQVTKAKDLITGSLIGLVILSCSWIILNTVNPATLNFKSISISSIESINVVEYCGEISGKMAALYSDGKYLNTETKKELTETGEVCVSPEECLQKDNNRYECLNQKEYSCCQYKKNSVTGITCQTIKFSETCPTSRNGSDFEKVYTGQQCVFNNGQNNCITKWQ